MAAGVADRLLTLVEIELTALEDDHPAACEGSGDEPLDAASATKRARERIDLLAAMARTTEKLLELRRSEAAAAGQDEGDGETGRLRADLIAELRDLDARREAGPGLFDPASGVFVGERRALAPTEDEPAPALGADGSGASASAGGHS